MIKTLRLAAVIAAIGILRFVRLDELASRLDDYAAKKSWGC